MNLTVDLDSAYLQVESLGHTLMPFLYIKSYHFCFLPCDTDIFANLFHASPVVFLFDLQPWTIESVSTVLAVVYMYDGYPVVSHVQAITVFFH